MPEAYDYRISVTSSETPAEHLEITLSYGFLFVCLFLVEMLR